MEERTRESAELQEVRKIMKRSGISMKLLKWNIVECVESCMARLTRDRIASAVEKLELGWSLRKHKKE